MNTLSKGATERTTRRRPRIERVAPTDSLQPYRIIGFLHLVLGAIGTTTFIITFLFSPQPIFLLVQAVFVALITLSGLWILDGKRRGAILAIVMDALQCVSAFLVSQLSIDFVIAALLLVGAIWILPALPIEKS